VRFLAESLNRFDQRGSGPHLRRAIALAGRLAVDQAAYVEGTELLAAATRGRSLHVSLHPPERADCDASLAAARAALGPVAYAAAWDTGQAMTEEDAVKLALSR
jgi:hypothetical protein